MQPPGTPSPSSASFQISSLSMSVFPYRVSLLFQSSRYQRIRFSGRGRMTGTNHSKTNAEVPVPRIVDEPGGAAQSISFITIIRPIP